MGSPVRGDSPVRRVAARWARVGALSLALLSVCAGVGAPPAHARAPLTGFIATPTEQLALPGALPGGEITPEGDIYTGWAEYQLAYGIPLRGWDQPTRMLADPSLPLYQARLRDRQVVYTQRVFTTAVAGRPVVYLTVTAHNTGARRQTARVALQVEYTRGPQAPGFHGFLTSPSRYERPAADIGPPGFFEQLGEEFSPAWEYAVAGRDIVRDGLLLARGPARPAQTLATPASAAPQAPHVLTVYTQPLGAHGSVALTWQIPLAPPVADARTDRALDGVPLTAARAAMRALWAAQEAGMTRIDVPEPRVDAVYLANVVAILQSRYLTRSGWVQAVNRLQYQSYWIRDSAIETVALDDIGLHTAAAQNLAFLSDWQQPNGLYISRTGQQDGVGEALWELAQHALLTGSPAFAAHQLRHVAAAVGWIARAGSSDPLGLLPPSTILDDEFITGAHITGDNLWAAVGLRSAVTLARVAGHRRLAHAWQTIDHRFEAALDRALTTAAATVGHIPPALDATGGYDWGNYNAAYPLPILRPASPLVHATVRWATGHFREGLATYGPSLHDYLGFPIDETELDAGDAHGALAGFYAELAHTTAPGYGWEDGPTPDGNRQDGLNLTPHGTFAGQYVTLLRNLLVRDSGPTVLLLSGVSPAWMRPGQTITVTDAPTHHGTISFALTTTAAGATLRWTSTLPAGTPIDWALPYWVASAQTAGGERITRALRLPAPSGQATLTFTARRPPQSLARTIAALNRGYIAHGQQAPITPRPRLVTRGNSGCPPESLLADEPQADRERELQPACDAPGDGRREGAADVGA